MLFFPLFLAAVVWCSRDYTTQATRQFGFIEIAKATELFLLAQLQAYTVTYEPTLHLAMLKFCTGICSASPVIWDPMKELTESWAICQDSTPPILPEQRAA